jgi:dTDP-4-amino-4,6-dideoxy-D-galactose acyltransferase
MTTSEPICTYLDWDSQFFGLRIARVNQHLVNENQMKLALEWCECNNIDCLYLLAEPNDARTMRLAEQRNFIQTDARMTLERPLRENLIATQAPMGVVRFAQEEDLTLLREIASTAHRDTRFYFDAHFDRHSCDLLYATWIEKSLQGFAEAVLVVEVNAQPVGYVTCHLRQQESQIGLLGVAKEQTGKGLGKSLVEGFLVWSVEHGSHRATVVTQARNIGALRLYQRCGFLPSSLQLWYHRWFSD